MFITPFSDIIVDVVHRSIHFGHITDDPVMISRLPSKIKTLDIGKMRDSSFETTNYDGQPPSLTGYPTHRLIYRKLFPSF